MCDNFSDFTNETYFEDAFCETLKANGWKDGEVIKYAKINDLIENWKDIIFKRNKGVDRLNNVPLTNTEMEQILNQLNSFNADSLKINEFINGSSIFIQRDNPLDKDHLNQAIAINLFDRNEIVGGSSYYQIARQTRFGQDEYGQERRGDITLLINGMPLIHIELKAEGIDVSNAIEQIKSYKRKGIFKGFMSLIQFFCACTPTEMVYFANNDELNEKFMFEPEDVNNNYINDYKKYINEILSIPKAHYFIGYYLCTDSSDKTLKILRTYQCNAIENIEQSYLSHLKIINDKANRRRGGYVYHTTGSGKTLTAFKAGQILCQKRGAKKVACLLDRTELDKQTFENFKQFTPEDFKNRVQDVSSSYDLIKKLASDNINDNLIVASIQKLNRIDRNNLQLKKIIDKANSKEIVFIIDECHRSTFGEMLANLKDTFPLAIMFGFSGTPIMSINPKNGLTTADVFGDELCRYTIRDGIRDGNVLPFNLEQCISFDYDEAKAKYILDILNVENFNDLDERGKKKFYDLFQKKTNLDVDLYLLSNKSFETNKYRKIVIDTILKKIEVGSKGFEFHSILATESKKEAIEYYKLLKEKEKNGEINFKFAITFSKEEIKDEDEEFLIQALEDYNKNFDTKYNISDQSYSEYKNDICLRLSHRREVRGKDYTRVKHEDGSAIDLIIVVDQLLTGFDSKYINTIFYDKVRQDELIIQHFSRTNRVINGHKLYGNIFYFRAPYLMEELIKKAVDNYAGKNAFEVFVPLLYENVCEMNALFLKIKSIFESEGIFFFEKILKDEANIKQFKIDCIRFKKVIDQAYVQDFRFNIKKYHNKDNSKTVELGFTYEQYIAIMKRYEELFPSDPKERNDTEPLIIDGSGGLSNKVFIDEEYFEKNAKKYIINIIDDENSEKAYSELHKLFASFSKEEQSAAEKIINDLKNGKMNRKELEKGVKTLIYEIINGEKIQKINKYVEAFGLNGDMLSKLLAIAPDDRNLDENGRFTKLKDTVDKNKAKLFFEAKDQKSYSLIKINILIDTELRAFILSKGTNSIFND